MANITTRINNWIIFYTVLLIVWIAIVVMALESLLPNNANFVTRVVEICSNSASDLNISGVFFMWFLMSIAMMSPTIIPTLKTYEDILESGGKRENSFWWFITGFLSVWMIFSILMSLTQVFLGRLYLLNDKGAFVSSLISSGFLVLAGLYQLSSYKEACLTKCQRPFTFFLQNWKSGNSGSFNMGVSIGLFCLGCCWALMALAFVGGVMNLAFMAIMTFFMMLEKIPDYGKYISKPLSLILIGSGTVLVWF
jgi:predicted metal-binding membrane protein